MYGNTWSLVSSFGSAASWIFYSCVDFNTFPFVSWTWRGKIAFFLFINGVFGIAKRLVAPVLTIALCEDGGYRIGCCKISLIFISGCFLTKISAPSCHSITNVISSWGISNVEFLLWHMEGDRHTPLVCRSFTVLPYVQRYAVPVGYEGSRHCLIRPWIPRVAL